MTFADLLKRAGLRKTDLALKLGLSTRTISSWRDSPPRYAVAYLELYIEYNRYRP